MGLKSCSFFGLLFFSLPSNAWFDITWTLGLLMLLNGESVIFCPHLIRKIELFTILTLTRMVLELGVNIGLLILPFVWKETYLLTS